MRPKVLIVDDEKLFVESLTEHLRLRRPDIAFYYTTSPLKALELNKENPMDIVITDIRMPEMSGLELLMRIKEENPGVKIIVMTAYGNQDIKNQVFQKGATKYIAKPFTIEELEELIDESIQEIKNFKGVLSGFTLMDTLQLANMSKKSVVTCVRSEDCNGKIWIKKGDPIHATLNWNNNDTIFGERALLELLMKCNHAKVYTSSYKEPPKHTIVHDLSFLVNKISNDTSQKVKEKAQKTETQNILNIEQSNIKRLERKYKDSLLGLWIINTFGKVILAKIYDDKVYELKQPITKEIREQFVKWKRGELLAKIHPLLKSPLIYFKVLSARKKYLVCAVFKEKYEGLINLENEKGGIVMPGPKEIAKALELLSDIEGSEGAAVVSDEGLVLEARLDPKYDPDKIGALISVALEAAEKVTKETGWGKTNDMVIEGDEGKMVIYRIPMGFIVLLGRKNMNLGLARVQVNQASEILGGS